MSEIFLLTLCASAKAYEAKLKDREIDLEKAALAFGDSLDVLAKTPVMIVIQIGNVAATIYKKSIMIKNVDEATAKRYANRIIKKLGSCNALTPNY